MSITHIALLLVLILLLSRFKALIQFDRPGDIIKFAKRKLCNDESVFRGQFLHCCYRFTRSGRIPIVPQKWPQYGSCARNGSQARRVTHARCLFHSQASRIHEVRLPLRTSPCGSGSASYVRAASRDAEHILGLPSERLHKRARAWSIDRSLSFNCGYDRARGWDGQGQFSDPIRLVDFLRALFGDTNYEHMKTSLAFNVVGEGVVFRRGGCVCVLHTLGAGWGRECHLGSMCADSAESRDGLANFLRRGGHRYRYLCCVSEKYGTNHWIGPRLRSSRSASRTERRRGPSPLRWTLSSRVKATDDLT